MNTHRITSLFLGLALVGSALAETKTFTVGGQGRDARQLATITSDTELENFIGRTEKVTGTLTFDPVKKTGGGKVVVDLASVNTGLGLRDEHMRSEGWLHTDKFPTATFEATKVRHLSGDQYEVTGKFTLKGVTRNVTTRAKVRYLPESERTRAARFQGDVLNVSAKFDIKLSDYNVVLPPPAKGKVAEVVTINLTAVATTK